MKVFVALLLSIAATGALAQGLSSKYPFQKVLFDDLDQYYALYWNFSSSAGTIHFAVNVSTTGWVGFGVSPNGQMPGSDVVIGWVASSGNSYFHDRFADIRARPPIDESQDWFLLAGREENGFTILEFSRNLTTCDPRDLDIDSGTARVVWSFSNTDPSDPLGNTAAFHNYQGSLSLNLLGGLPVSPSEPADLQFFELTLSNVTIPSASTTYWCQSFLLPQEIRNSTRYITRVSPVIAPHVRSYVHHMLVYQCITPLNETFLGVSGSCGDVPREVSACRGGVLISGWAIGGEDFVYPENVALPLGGPGTNHHIVIEMHYDNPGMVEGVLDSSGMRYYYTSVPREHDAGILFLGHAVSPYMVVPPKTLNYTIGGVCTSNCTKTYIPDGGIRIIANFLHTHLVGRGLELQHLRWNSECNVFEELPPIDVNLNYDFNFQQYTHLPREVTVLPGDILVLKCFYNTTANVNATFGGESTIEEMCLTFPVYYPRPKDRQNLDFCISHPTVPEVFNSFGQKYLPLNPRAAQLYFENRIFDSFNAINWTPETIQDLENGVLGGPAVGFCSSSSTSDPGVSETFTGVPQSRCPYEASNKCTGFQPESCCDRIATTAGEATLITQLSFATILFSALIGLMFAASA